MSRSSVPSNQEFRSSAPAVRKSYAKPGIIFRSPLEAVADVCLQVYTVSTQGTCRSDGKGSLAACLGIYS